MNVQFRKHSIYMKKILSLSVVLFTFIQFINGQPFSYPATKKVEHTDDYFGTKVSDPYRWLEDEKSAETAAWVKEENKITFDYLDKIPFRSKLKDRLTTLWNFQKRSVPFKGGNNYYMYMNDGLQNQYILNVLKGKWNATPEPFLDPISVLFRFQKMENGWLMKYPKAVPIGARSISRIPGQTKSLPKPFNGLNFRGFRGKEMVSITHAMTNRILQTS